MLSEPVATVLGAMVGFVGGLLVAWMGYRQKSDELFFRSFDFLGVVHRSGTLGSQPLSCIGHESLANPGRAHNISSHYVRLKDAVEAAKTPDRAETFRSRSNGWRPEAKLHRLV